MPSVWAMSCCNIQQASWCSTTQVKAISCCLSIRQRCIKLASLGVAMACTPGIRLLHHSCTHAWHLLFWRMPALSCSLARSLTHSLTYQQWEEFVHPCRMSGCRVKSHQCLWATLSWPSLHQLKARTREGRLLHTTASVENPNIWHSQNANISDVSSGLQLPSQAC